MTTDKYQNYERASLQRLWEQAEKAASVDVDAEKSQHLQADLERIEKALGAVETIGDTFKFFSRPNFITIKANNLAGVRNDLATLQASIDDDQKTNRQAIAEKNTAIERTEILKEALKHRDQIESRLNGKMFGIFGRPFGHTDKWTKDEYETAVSKAKYDNPASGGTQRQNAIIALQADLERMKGDIRWWVEENVVQDVGIGELTMTSPQHGTAKGCVLYRCVEADKRGKHCIIADKDAKVLRVWHDERQIQKILQKLGVPVTAGAFVPASIWDMDKDGNVHGRQFTKDLPEFLTE